jgi:hypothetical protein|tara:strand:+ start:1360 stop:2163 length:804 start_codon:yes stop_codon:yes gene_type:complete
MFPLLLTQTVQISKDDKLFAKQLCEGDKIALSNFQELFSDELFYIASKFIYRIRKQINYNEAWPYRNKKGYTIYVDDDVATTYVWLVEFSGKKSCKYIGINGASFSTYITSVLNHNWTSVDHFRWYKSKQSEEIPDDILEDILEDIEKPVSPEDIQDFKIIENIFVKVLSTLSDSENKFMSIYDYLNAAQIYDTFSPFPDYMEKLKILNIKDVYLVYTRLKKKVYNNFVKLFPKEFHEYEINEEKIKTSLEVYYYYIKKDNINSSNE